MNRCLHLNWQSCKNSLKCSNELVFFIIVQHIIFLKVIFNPRYIRQNIYAG